MFPHLTSFKLRQWIDENRADWGQRRTIWEDSDYIAFVTRGPNARRDFHVNPGDEIFHQLEGELNLHYLSAEGEEVVAVLKPGEMLLLPRNVPHSPRRAAGSWTLVIERKRGPEERDRFAWFCEACHQPLYETALHFGEPSDAIRDAYEAMRDAKNRTCTRCGEVAPLPA